MATFYYVDETTNAVLDLTQPANVNQSTGVAQRAIDVIQVNQVGPPVQYQRTLYAAANTVVPNLAAAQANQTLTPLPAGIIVTAPAPTPTTVSPSTAAAPSIVELEGSVSSNPLFGPGAPGNVSVSNFPATQPVSGTVSVSNLPATQPVSGTVSVSNFPATQPVSGTVTPGTVAAPGYLRLEDGTSNNLAAVLAFHNADQQSIPANGYGLLTGGVAQLLNAAGSLNRARETSVDAVSNGGLPAGATQNAMAFSTTTTTATAIGTSTVFTPAAMSGTVKGAPWSIQVNHALRVDTGAQQETVVVISVTATTFTAITTKTHASGVTIAGFVYNQQKDGTLPDGSTPAGVNASTTYFWNAALNAGVGGIEIERSAAGELDGASGAGTAVAAEYEYNGGGPVLASGLASGLTFDRARSLQGKGRQSATITTTTAGAPSLVFASAAATNLIGAGQPIFLSVGTGLVVETAYTTASWVPGSSATVPLINPVVNAGSTQAAWAVYAPNGPGLSGFTVEGVGIEEEALYNPVDGLMYIERSATQDNMPRPNVVAESEVLLNSNQGNGGGFDSARSNIAVALIPSAAFTTTQTSPDQLNVNGHALHVILDVTVPGTGSVTVAINGKDPASGKYYPLLTGVAVTTASTNVYRVGPALTPAANAVANDWVPRIFQVVVTANNANAVTYSLGYNLSE
ncbi:MAG: hypothetical protein NVS3B1_20430 [Marmoricola sp.]